MATVTIRMAPLAINEAQHKVSIGVDQLGCGEWLDDAAVIEELVEVLGFGDVPRARKYTMSRDAAVWLLGELENDADILDAQLEAAESRREEGQLRRIIKRVKEAIEELTKVLDADPPEPPRFVRVWSTPDQRCICLDCAPSVRNKVVMVTLRVAAERCCCTVCRQCGKAHVIQED